MERLDLSSFAKEIKKAYNDVVLGDNTYAIFTTQKDSSLKPTAEGDGDIREFVTEFDEGAVQFGVLKVNPYGSDVNKIVLLGWCPDSAPLKSRVSYATNFAEVGKVLSYHVDITARDFDDLDVDDILETVSKASGARYSIQSVSKPKTNFRPSPKPESPVEKAAPAPKPVPAKRAGISDEWGGEKEIEVRDFNKQPITQLPSAYKPTKVDIDALRKSKPKAPQRKPEVVKPVEPVKPEEPEEEEEQEEQEEPEEPEEPEDKPVQPIVKPIAAPVKPKPSVPSHEIGRISISLEGGLTELPKPKTSHSVLSRYKEKVVTPEYGTKPPSFSSGVGKDDSHKLGGLKNFGNQGGLTPAQLWAQKKGKFNNVARDEKPVNAEEVESSPVQPVEDVKSKFEKLNVKSTEQEKPTTSVFDKFNGGKSGENEWEVEKKEEEEEEEPAPLPSRPIVPEPVEPKEEPEEEPKEEEPKREQPKEEPKVEQPKEEVNKPEETKSEPSAHTAVADYDYEKDEDNEIAFSEGEKITNIQFVDEDWWVGTNSKGETGLFPASYVKLADKTTADVSEPVDEPTSTAPSSAPTPASGPSAVADYDYDAAESNELTFKEGDIISDIDKVDEDWWLGSLNGERKLFPANYVSLKE
ncbi:DEKNAAC102782 [Brettanomyces naardenensis]|uniref:DEKNAAC102782 n=1 Tax=Brettanomyces naardenensis TaxID=13370 RepID=A0A448YL45_BRENA|nr:DEKNAAC102782 [Brettanomyces naardenensis]